MLRLQGVHTSPWAAAEAGPAAAGLNPLQQAPAPGGAALNALPSLPAGEETAAAQAVLRSIHMSPTKLNMFAKLIRWVLPGLGGLVGAGSLVRGGQPPGVSAGSTGGWSITAAPRPFCLGIGGGWEPERGVGTMAIRQASRRQPHPSDMWQPGPGPTQSQRGIESANHCSNAPVGAPPTRRRGSAL